MTVPPVPVCGIGASAGGIEALKQLFSELSPQLGLAYVIVVHLAPDRHSELPNIIASVTPMPVRQVGDHDEMKLVPDTVYVIAPGRMLRITDASVAAAPFEPPHGPRNAIDLFLRSLAAAHGDGFAVVLSGSGSDGALGAKAVKESGGLVLVQDPSDAAYGDMPRAVIATGLADVVLPARALAVRLAELSRSKKRVSHVLQAAGATAQMPETEERAFRGVLAFLSKRTGHDFSKYKRATVLRRLSRRMQLRERSTIADYLRYLDGDGDEVRALLGDLLISVTTFFRDPEAWAALHTRVVGPLVEQSDGREQIRAWVPGCATGEEAYSLAFLLHEEFEKRALRPNFIVFASDVDEEAIGTAREGVYSRAIGTDVSERHLERYFRAEEDHYRIETTVRDHVVFAVHSILRDPPFSRQHLVSCRNVLIYLERDLQEQVMAVFRYACRDHAFLFLGASEMANDDLFRALDAKHRIFVTIESANGRTALPDILAAARPSPTKTRDSGPPLRPSPGHVHLDALEAASPPSVLVDERWNVLHLSASAARFLQQAGGAPARRLTDCVRPELRDELHMLLNRAIDEPTAQRSRFIAVTFNGAKHDVAMVAQRHLTSRDQQTYVLVTFMDAGIASPDTTLSDHPPSDEFVRNLQDRLRQAEGRIERMREDHFLTQEDLRAANEELQSVHEEYRATTEELETSKEELQSINEELQTVNHALAIKLEEVSRAQADLENFVAAANVPMLFLDRELHVRRFTPRLGDLFSIRSRDIDRPVSELANTLEQPSLTEMARQVLDQSEHGVIERAVRTATGQTFIMRVGPYHTVPQQPADGVVVTFIDVTAIKEVEEALRQAHADLEQRVRDRTTDLAAANSALQTEVRERRAAEERIKELVGRLLAAQEEERRRIARDMHDQLGQPMTALRIGLESASLAGDLAATKEQLARTQRLAEEVDESIDFITWDLRPAALDHVGAVGALTNLVNGWSQRFGIPAEFDARWPEGLRLAPEVEGNLYRLLQEALHNILKHAHASHVSVMFEQRAGEALLIIEDDGRGFDVQAQLARSEGGAGLGLVSMRERARMVGGVFTIESSPGAGTSLYVRVPLEGAAPRHVADGD